jgi:hypothetical protein
LSSIPMDVTIGLVPVGIMQALPPAVALGVHIPSR